MAVEQIYCCIRKMWVSATPEEKVRQNLLAGMIHSLEFPAGNIMVEQGLKEMPHLALSSLKMPIRRADIVVFAKGIHPQYNLFPLVLIECKAIKLNDKVLNQALGYNHFLQAYYLAIANQDAIKTYWIDKSKEELSSVDFLPPYKQLLNSLIKNS